MKAYILISFLFLSTGLWAQESNGKSATAEFKVEGVCGMCKERIEEAANFSKGVKISSWDKKTKMIEVTYNPKKTNLDEIGQAIAKAGYSNQYAKAGEDDYGKLPGCCKYEEVKDH